MQITNICVKPIEGMRFETTLRGRMLEMAAKQQMTLNLANLLLKTAADCWFSKYDADGKWLSGICEAEPDKGALISGILNKDLCFDTEIKQVNSSKYIEFVAPAIGAVIGGGIARTLRTKFLAAVFSAAIPAGAFYIAAHEYEQNSAGNTLNKLLDDYIKQLERYKVSIESILCN